MEIRYLTSKSGLENCFEIVFDKEDTLPEQYRCHGDYAELFYYLELFRYHVSFECDIHGTDMIWMQRYDCMCDDIPFCMMFDKEYHTISFALEDHLTVYRSQVAEQILALIRSEQTDSKRH